MFSLFRLGACPDCAGLGTRLEVDPARVIPDRSLSIRDGGLLKPWARMPMADSWYGKILVAIAKAHGWDPKIPVRDLPPEAIDYFLHAQKGEQVRVGYRHAGGENTYNATFEGIVPNLERRYRETDSALVREDLSRYRGVRACTSCEGTRLRREARIGLVNRIVDGDALADTRQLGLLELVLRIHQALITGQHKIGRTLIGLGHVLLDHPGNDAAAGLGVPRT